MAERSTPESRERARYKQMQAYMDEEERKRNRPQPEPMRIPRSIQRGERATRSHRSGTKGEQAAAMIGAAELATAPFSIGLKGLATGFKAGGGLLKKKILGDAKKKGNRRMIPEREKAVLNKVGAQRPGAKTNRNPLAPKKKPLQTTKPVGDGKGTFELRGAQRKAMEELGKIDPKVWATKIKTAPKPTPKKDPVKLVKRAWESGTKKGEAAAKARLAATKAKRGAIEERNKVAEGIAKQKMARGQGRQVSSTKSEVQVSNKEIDAVLTKKVGSRGSTVTTDPKTGVTTMRDAKGKLLAKKVPVGKDGPPSTLGKRPATKRTTGSKKTQADIEEEWRVADEKARLRAGIGTPAGKRPATKKIADRPDAFARPQAVKAEKAAEKAGLKTGKSPGAPHGNRSSRVAKPQVTKIDRADTIAEAAKATARNKKAVLQKAAEKKAELRGYGTGPGGKLTAAEKAKISADLNKKGVEGYKEILKESGATGGSVSTNPVWVAGKGRMSKFDAFLKGIFRESAKKKGLPLNRPGAGKSSKRVTRGPWKPTPSPRYRKRGGGGSKGSKSPGN